jgi:hypothetical protein
MSLTLKAFIESGNYLIDEVKTRSEKNDKHFFDADTMRFFSSRILELAWKKDDNIYFITSEADKNPYKHQGSIRAFTVRKSNNNGCIDTVGDFQGHPTKREAQKAIKEILEN